ncbi:MAG TPA: hypothetical protein VFV92_10095 [Candidatus Bathyarchaeia archaeon]|nr:hypothetical protein [Candidatus Bathyarchaeia archaeon]
MPAPAYQHQNFIPYLFHPHLPRNLPIFVTVIWPELVPKQERAPFFEQRQQPLVIHLTASKVGPKNTPSSVDVL